MTNRGKTKAQLTEELKEMHQMVEKLGALVVEQTAAEKSLRMAQFALDCVPDGAYWMGPDGRFLYVNDAACRFLGYSREELLTMRVSDINPEHPQERWVDHWNKVKERGAVTFETVQQAKDGQIYPVEIAATHFEFDGKMYICSLVRDITERKGGGEELRSYQKKLRALTS